MKPAFAGAYVTLGIALYWMGRLDEAMACCRQALHLQPGFADAEMNLGMMQLLRGELAEGWRGYEARWSCADGMKFRRNFSQPRWEGGPLEGRRILLHAEQGFGDTIQFVRYAQVVAKLGGRVIVECQRALAEMIGAMPGIHTVLARGEALPAFDVECPLLSVPLALGTTLETIPGGGPYLHADPHRAEYWRQRIMAAESQTVAAQTRPQLCRVGLVWSGLATQKNNRDRSLPAALLAPLGLVPGVTFYSLQKGAGAEIFGNAGDTGLPITDWTNELHDFSDTAALVENLDLVLCVCTGVSHLAAAMGKPTWIMLGAVADWRWLREREDSPWYPSMRLFRQKKAGEWAETVERVTVAMGQQAAQQRT